MKSVCCSGTNPSLVWGPLNRPAPGESAGSDRLHRLVLVVRRALEPLVRRRLVRRREPVELVLLEDPEADDRVDAGDPEQRDRPEVATLHAADGEQAEHDADQHHVRPEVGLELHERERDEREPDDHGESPRVDVTAVLVHVAGERHDQTELRDLRRLELEPERELEPRLGTLGVRTERREHEEQQQRS